MMHRHSFENATGGRRVLLVAAHIALGGVCILSLALTFGYVVMRLWNSIFPEVVGARPLSYWQAVGLLILARILVGGFHRGGPGGKFRGKRRPFPRPSEQHDAALDEFIERGRSSKDPI